MEQRYELDLRMSESGIISNASTLQQMIEDGLKSYNYVVDDTNYDQASKDRTKLNNLETRLKEKRASFEKNELGEWAKTKKIIMDTEKKIKAVSECLKEGIDAINEKEKVSKMERIREKFNEIPLPLPIRFEQLYDRKDYDRKAMTEKKIMESMQAKIDKIVEDAKMMDLFLPDNPVEREQIKRVYCETLEIGAAKQKADDLVKLHKEVESKKQVSTQPKEERSEVETMTKPKVETLRQQRILVEFVATRPFYDAMNKLVAEYRPHCKVIEREDV